MDEGNNEPSVLDVISQLDEVWNTQERLDLRMQSQIEQHVKEQVQSIMASLQVKLNLG